MNHMKRERFSESLKVRVRATMRDAINQEAMRRDTNAGAIIRDALKRHLIALKRAKA